MGPGDLSALSFAALPPPLAPKATGMPSPAPQLLPALVCLGNEGRLLARIMYKSKNQHRAAGYFHKLQQIARTLKNIMRIGLYLQSVCGEKVPASLACTAAEPMATHAASLARLCDKAQADCRAAYSSFEALFNELNFVPLAVTGLALLARIHLCVDLLRGDLEVAHPRA